MSWDILPKSDSKNTEYISEKLGVEASIANLLVQRGSTSFDEAKESFRQKLDRLNTLFFNKVYDGCRPANRSCYTE